MAQDSLQFKNTLAQLKANDATLEELDLSVEELTDDDVKHLVAALQHNTTLKTLNLELNNLTDTAGKALVKLLQTNTTLTTIYTWKNDITKSIVDVIWEGLIRNRSHAVLERIVANKLQPNDVDEKGTLDLREFKPTINYIETLFKALPTKLNITGLDFYGSDISDTVAKALAEGLKHNKTLEVLSLSSNNITDTGAEALAQMLEAEENNTLIQIDLQENTISEALQKRIAACLTRNRIRALSKRIRTQKLQPDDTNYDKNTLRLWDLKELHAAHIQTLFEALSTNPNITDLDFYDSDISDTVVAEALAEGLQHNTTLQCLNLSNTKIGDKGLEALVAALRHNKTLERLAIQSNNITDAGGEALAQMLEAGDNTTLTDLYLGGNTISEAIQKRITACLTRNRIRALSERIRTQQLQPDDTNDDKNTLRLGYLEELRATHIQTLFKALSTNPNITDLDFWGSDISDTVAEALAEGLQHNTTLQRLHLNYKKIGDKGLEALVAALRHNKTLERLAIESNNITDAGGEALAQMLEVGDNTTLIHIDLYYGNSISEAIQKRITACLERNRKHILLERITAHQLRPSDAENGTLRLEKLELTDTHMEALAKHLATDTTITTLHLEDNPFTDTGAEALAQILESWDNTTLTQVIFGKESKIAQDIQNRIDTCLERNRRMTLIARIQNQQLTQTDKSYGDADIQQSVLQANNMGLDTTHIQTLLTSLKKHNIAFTGIDFGYNNIGSAGIQVLMEGLTNHNTLQYLCFIHNTTGPKGTAVIADFLKGNTTLTELILYENAIEDKGLEALVAALKDNKTLEELNLLYNKLTDTGGEALAQMLEAGDNTTLTYINLDDGNSISEAIQKRITACLERNRRMALIARIQNRQLTQTDESYEDADIRQGVLQARNMGFNATHTQTLLNTLATHNIAFTGINFSNNNIGPEKIAALLRKLKNTNTLKTLGLGGNNLRPEDATTVATFLKGNTILTKLNLYGNAIEDKGLEALVAALKDNKTLEELNLLRNKLTDTGGEALAQMLEAGDNTTLTHIDLDWCNDISETIQKRITACLERNRKMAFIERIKTNQLRSSDWYSDKKLRINLEHYTPSDITALRKALKTNTSITQLPFKEEDIPNTIDVDVLKGYAERNRWIAFLRRIETQQLNSNDAIGYKDNHEKKALDLRWRSSFALTPARLKTLCKVASTNPSITGLCFHLNNATLAESTEALVQGLTANTNITTLEFNYDAIKDKATLKKIFGALKRNTQLAQAQKATQPPAPQKTTVAQEAKPQQKEQEEKPETITQKYEDKKRETLIEELETTKKEQQQYKEKIQTLEEKLKTKEKEEEKLEALIEEKLDKRIKELMKNAVPLAESSNHHKANAPGRIQPTAPLKTSKQATKEKKQILSIQKEKQKLENLTEQWETLEAQREMASEDTSHKQKARKMAKLSKQLLQQHRKTLKTEYQTLVNTKVSEKDWQQIGGKIQESLGQDDTTQGQTDTAELRAEVLEVQRKLKKQIAFMKAHASTLTKLSGDSRLATAKKKALDEKLKNPHVQDYYYTLVSEMNRLFMAASVAQTGYIAAQNKPGGVSARASKLLKGIGKLVPNFGGYFEAAGDLVDNVGLHYTESFLSAVAEIAHSPDEMNKIVKTVAYELVMNTPEDTLDAAQAREHMKQMITNFRETELGDKKHDTEIMITLFLQALGHSQTATVEFERKKPGLVKRCWKSFTSCIPSSGAAEEPVQERSRVSQETALNLVAFSGSAQPEAAISLTGGGTTSLSTRNKPRM